MEAMMKTVIAVLNFVCYLVTMAYPCDVTVYTLLPSVIVSSAWIVESGTKSTVTVWHRILLATSAILCALCIFLGSTTTVTAATLNSNDYFFTFRQSVAVIGGKQLSYIIFAVAAIIIYLLLTVPEVALAYVGASKRVAVHSFDDIVNKKIK